MQYKFVGYVLIHDVTYLFAIIIKFKIGAVIIIIILHFFR